jgi:hypothetical protein
MITGIRKHAFALAIATLGLAAKLAPAQAVLFSNSREFATFPIGSALADLELEHTFVQTNQQTLDALRAQDWDLVIVRRMERFGPAFEADILAELHAHVDRGGKLHFQMADLENVPQGWYDLLGLEGAGDLELPLSDIRAPLPVHPSVPGIGLLGLSDERYPPDYGDVLIPGPDAFVTQWYEIGRRTSSVVSRDGRVLVNGQQWDNWAGGEGFAAVQITWLLGCHADLDGDGELTVFDFLEFQNLFDSGDPRADACYDGRLDIFDFLEFFNQFEIGCR